ncbi:MAG: UPF0317 protein [Dehalococcoidia bacterium]|nr:MAG: UPF0317 protein [Dehalococcoidia bacterium]
MDAARDAIGATAAEARALIRAGRWSGLTETLAQRFVHLAPVVVPADWVLPLLQFCIRNPSAGPILELLAPGDWETGLAPGGDIRTDVVRWQIWEAGRLTGEVTDLRPVWREDLVTVLLGTSHILAGPLKAAGISAETVDNPRPAIYRTALPTQPAGPLSGPHFVTVKFARPEEIATIFRVTGRYPAGHGAPIHAGDPALIGVDGVHPAFGFPLEVPAGRVPLFWPCGFTVLEALRAARLPWLACHAPGCTFIVDLPPERLSV